MIVLSVIIFRFLIFMRERRSGDEVESNNEAGNFSRSVTIMTITISIKCFAKYI